MSVLLSGRGRRKSVWLRSTLVRPITLRPAACSRSQLIGPYRLSMSITT